MPLKVCAIVVAVLAVVSYWWLMTRPRLPLKEWADNEYDYIIVGGGAAGCVLARRLTEEPSNKVLLLEAGDEGTHTNLEVPLDAEKAVNTPHDWQYLITRQTRACLGLKNNECPWNRGKTLGGSTAINSMTYVRGNKADFDDWEKAGAKGWNYEEVLPYFIKAEGMVDEKLSKSPYHGTTGPLKTKVQKFSELADIIMETREELGLGSSEDYNGAEQLGMHYPQETVVDGVRASTSRVYLWPVMDRDNLHVVVNAHVMKVLFEGKTAVGVKHNSTREVRAKKEVILSAGTIGSPQLLMLSGVGPKKHLEEIDIPVVSDLPGVGENLNDHLTTWGPETLISEPLSFLRDDHFDIVERIKWHLFRSGMKAKGCFAGNYVWLRTKWQKASEAWPDLQIQLSPFLAGSGVDDGDLRDYLKMQNELWDDYYNYRRRNMGYTARIFVTRPTSRGTIRLRNKDPFVHPTIEPNYNNENDMKRLIEGCGFVERLAQTSPMKRIGARLRDYERRFPGCESLDPSTDDYWMCAIPRMTMTMYHATSSCKMGASSDPMAVVDPELRVRGVQNLRVIDASVMPFVVSANTNAATIMIAEKAADTIRGIKSVEKAEI